MVKFSELAIDVSAYTTSGAFRSLLHGRLLAFFAFSMVSVLTTVQTYRLSGDSTLAVALLATVWGVSGFLGGLVGGVAADRYDNRNVLLRCRAVSLVGFAVLCGNAASPEPMLWIVFVVAAVDAAFGAAGAAAFSAAATLVVPPERFSSAAALMSGSMDAGMVVAPALTSVLLIHSGFMGSYGVATLLGGLSLIAILRLPPLTEPDPEPQPPTSWWADFSGGLAFTAKHRVVAPIMALGFIQILLAAPFPLLPQFLETVLQVDAAAMGYLMSASSVGALLVTVTSGWTSRVRRVGLAVAVCVVASSLAVAGLGFSRSLVAALIVMGILGALDVLFEILRFTILAQETPQRLRGRVFAVWGTQASLSESVGGPLLATLVRPFGIAGAIVAGGVAATVLSLATLFYWRDLVHWQSPPASVDGTPSPEEPYPFAGNPVSTKATLSETS